MTLSLIKSPAAVSLVGNDILFKINSDNMYSAAGSKAYLGLAWATGDSAADKFNLSYGSLNYIQIEFTCAATPDESGTQYPAYVSGTMAAYMESLVPYFNANYYLRRDFYVEWDGAHLAVVIRARENGAEYTLTFTADTSNATEDSNVAGADDTVRDFYALICKTWLKKANVEDDILLGEDQLTPDVFGNVFFKIQEYLKSEVSFDFEWPEGLTTFLFKKADMITAFFIEYAETYDGVVKKVTSTRTTSTLALLGGIDRNKVAEINEELSTWWDKFLYKKDFLTYQPRELYVSELQPVKLSFLVWKSGVTSIKLRVIVYFTDKTNTSLAAKTITAAQYEVFECILSYQKLDLASLNKEINYYEVYITDQDDIRISISRYFYPDLSYRENERVFIFQNSLCSPDVVRFTGITENEIGIERNDYELLNPEGFTWRDFESGTFDNSEIQRFTFNTGWLNDLAKNAKQYADYLREFYLSQKIYELINNRLYPIKLISKKQTTGRSDEYLINVEFEAERAYSDKYYSRDENIHPSTGFEAKFEQSEFLNP